MHFPFCKQRDFGRENQPAKVLGWPAVRLRLAWGRLQHWGSHAHSSQAPRLARALWLWWRRRFPGVWTILHACGQPPVSLTTLSVWRGSGHAALGGYCWRRSTRMCGKGHQTRGSGRNPLYLVSRRCTHWRCQLSQCCQHHRCHGSASACVPGLIGTSTYSHGYQSGDIPDSLSLLSLWSCIFNDPNLHRSCDRQSWWCHSKRKACIEVLRISGSDPTCTYLPTGDKKPHRRSAWWPFLVQDRGLCWPALLWGNRTWALGNSLEVQWLGLGAFTARSWFQSLVGELRSRETRDTTKN